MSFDPIKFYHQAGIWFLETTGEPEARWRSIVSRSYYAAFLAARSEAGISNTSAESHKITADYYLFNGKAAIANRLNDLRLQRNSADYDLNQDCGKREAGTALKYSNRILTDLGLLSTPATGAST